MGVCMTDIKLDQSAGLTSYKTGAFHAIEWQDDLFVSMTKLEGSANYDTSTSAIYSKETFYWNRDTDDGDLAGRVPVKKDTTWRLLMINYNKDTEQSMIIEYGAAASQFMLAFATIATSLAVAYAF